MAKDKNQQLQALLQLATATSKTLAKRLRSVALRPASSGDPIDSNMRRLILARAALWAEVAQSIEGNDLKISLAELKQFRNKFHNNADQLWAQGNTASGLGDLRGYYQVLMEVAAPLIGNPLLNLTCKDLVDLICGAVNWWVAGFVRGLTFLSKNKHRLLPSVKDTLVQRKRYFENVVAWILNEQAASTAAGAASVERPSPAASPAPAEGTTDDDFVAVDAVSGEMPLPEGSAEVVVAASEPGAAPVEEPSPEALTVQSERFAAVAVVAAAEAVPVETAEDRLQRLQQECRADQVARAASLAEAAQMRTRQNALEEVLSQLQSHPTPLLEKKTAGLLCPSHAKEWRLQKAQYSQQNHWSRWRLRPRHVALACSGERSVTQYQQQAAALEIQAKADQEKLQAQQVEIAQCQAEIAAAQAAQAEIDAQVAVSVAQSAAPAAASVGTGGPASGDHGADASPSPAQQGWGARLWQWLVRLCQRITNFFSKTPRGGAQNTDQGAGAKEPPRESGLGAGDIHERLEGRATGPAPRAAGTPEAAPQTAQASTEPAAGPSTVALAAGDDEGDAVTAGEFAYAPDKPAFSL